MDNDSDRLSILRLDFQLACGSHNLMDYSVDFSIQIQSPVRNLALTVDIVGTDSDH